MWHFKIFCTVLLGLQSICNANDESCPRGQHSYYFVGRDMGGLDVIYLKDGAGKSVRGLGKMAGIYYKAYEIDWASDIKNIDRNKTYLGCVTFSQGGARIAVHSAGEQKTIVEQTIRYVPIDRTQRRGEL